MSTFKYGLEICSKEDSGTLYPLNRSESIIGRGDVDISINNATLSANHCLIRLDGTQITATDLQSRNGTIVNNKNILNETSLSSGDILSLGEVNLRIKATSNKERLSSKVPSGGNKNFIKAILNRLTKNDSAKSPYEKVSRNLLLLLVLLSWIILILPLYFVMQDEVTKSRVERACSLVSTLAASNIEAMRQGRQVMVDTSIVDKEPGVSLALITTNKGIVWAPKSLLNKTSADSYGEKATNAEQLLIQQRTDGNIDISTPIKYYDFKNGQSIKVGTARIIYDLKGLEFGPHWFLVAGLSSSVYLIITFFFFHKIVQTVKKDLRTFQDDCEDVIKGTTSTLEEKYSPEFNNLTVTFNRMLRKLRTSPEAREQGAAGEYSLPQITEMVNILDHAALLVDKMNVVIACNPAALELLGCKAEDVNNKSLLEIHSEKELYQEFLAFTCEATQGSTKNSATLKISSSANVEITSLPITGEYSLFLLAITR